MDIKDSFGLKPVRESFDLGEKKDMPLYMKESPFKNIKEMQDVRMKGILNSDKIRINKSDYTQRGEK